MTHLASVPDFERYAAVHLPKAERDYYWSGAAAQRTLRENQEAFRRLRLRPRVLHRDVSRVSTKTTILGNRIEFPIGAAPTALQRMAHEDGEIATAKALAALGSCMTLSSWSTVKTEDVARSAPNGLRWFQLYVYSDLDLTLSLVREAEAAGYKAIALTVDRPILGIKYNDKRNRFRLPSRLTLENFVDKISTISERKEGNYSGLARHVSGLVDSTWDWDKLTWLMSVTKLPIVLKGIITREDAREAVRRGVAGIWVSNHGGRQLDGAPATIEALPEIVEAVRGTKVEVYMDGGIRYGTDVLKALALGARAVFVGRPILYGLAYKGEDGVRQVMEILREEFRTAMALAGCAKVSDINRSLVVHESYYWSQL